MLIQEYTWGQRYVYLLSSISSQVLSASIAMTCSPSVIPASTQGCLFYQTISEWVLVFVLWGHCTQSVTLISTSQAESSVKTIDKKKIQLCLWQTWCPRKLLKIILLLISFKYKHGCGYRNVCLCKLLSSSLYPKKLDRVKVCWSHPAQSQYKLTDSTKMKSNGTSTFIWQMGVFGRPREKFVVFIFAGRES